MITIFGHFGNGGISTNSTGSGQKTQNSTTDNPAHGYAEYQFSATNPVVTRDLGFEAHKDTEVQVLKTGSWTLLWQYDGNLVLYGASGLVWASNTNGKGTDLYFQGDGNLVIYQSGNPVWASNTADAEKGGKGGRDSKVTWLPGKNTNLSVFLSHLCQSNHWGFQKWAKTFKFTPFNYPQCLLIPPFPAQTMKPSPLLFRLFLPGTLRGQTGLPAEQPYAQRRAFLRGAECCFPG